MRTCLVLATLALPMLASAGEDPPLLVAGQKVAGTLAVGDEIPVTQLLRYRAEGLPIRGKRFRLRGRGGGRWYVGLRSYGFDGHLVLRDEGGRVLAEDDGDSSVGHARIAMDSQPADAICLIDACAAGQTGEFELEL